MECDICGAKDDLVKVKTEDDEIIHLCRACYETQYEGYEKSTGDAEWEEDDEDDWDEDSDDEDDSFETEEDFEEDEELDNDEEEE